MEEAERTDPAKTPVPAKLTSDREDALARIWGGLFSKGLSCVARVSTSFASDRLTLSLSLRARRSVREEEY